MNNEDTRTAFQTAAGLLISVFFAGVTVLMLDFWLGTAAGFWFDTIPRANDDGARRIPADEEVIAADDPCIIVRLTPEEFAMWRKGRDNTNHDGA